MKLNQVLVHLKDCDAVENGGDESSPILKEKKSRQNEERFKNSAGEKGFHDSGKFLNRVHVRQVLLVVRVLVPVGGGSDKGVFKVTLELKNNLVKC